MITAWDVVWIVVAVLLARRVVMRWIGRTLVAFVAAVCNRFGFCEQCMGVEPKPVRGEWRIDGALSTDPGQDMTLCERHMRGFVTKIGGETFAKAVRGGSIQAIARKVSS